MIKGFSFSTLTHMSVDRSMFKICCVSELPASKCTPLVVSVQLTMVKKKLLKRCRHRYKVAISPKYKARRTWQWWKVINLPLGCLVSRFSLSMQMYSPSPLCGVARARNMRADDAPPGCISWRFDIDELSRTRCHFEIGGSLH